MDEEFVNLVKDTLQFLQKKETWPKLISKKENKTQKQKPPISKNWQLTPLALPTVQPVQFTSFFKSIDLSIPIRLFVSDSSDLLFLENVSRAITQHIAPSALFAGKLDTLLTNTQLRLILAPLTLLKKRFPQVHLHHFLKLEGPLVLPLADHYNVDLKHALWNRLKSFQNMPPSF